MNRYKKNNANVLERCVSECEKAVIMHVLIKTKGDQFQAAQLLGIKKGALVEKINQYEIECMQFES